MLWHFNRNGDNRILSWNGPGTGTDRIWTVVNSAYAAFKKLGLWIFIPLGLFSGRAYSCADRGSAPGLYPGITFVQMDHKGIGSSDEASDHP